MPSEPVKVGECVCRLSWEPVSFLLEAGLRNWASEFSLEGVNLEGKPRLPGEFTEPLIFEFGVPEPGVEDAGRILSRWP